MVNVLLGPVMLWTALPTSNCFVLPLVISVAPSSTVISGGMGVTVPETTNVNGFSTPSPPSASVFMSAICSEPDQTSWVFNVIVKVLVVPGGTFQRPGPLGGTHLSGALTTKCSVSANGWINRSC